MGKHSAPLSGTEAILQNMLGEQNVLPTPSSRVEELLTEILEAGGAGGTGRPGEDGKSAYEIAVDNGFDGTEAEWLESLKGEKGEDGSSRAKIEFAPTDIWDFYSKMRQAYQNGNTDVYIKRSTIEYTNAFIEHLTKNSIRGIPIGNGCRYYFASGCYLVCNYTGDNANVRELFSPLDSQNVSGDFEIYNLHLEAKNCIYALHDEGAGQWTFSSHKYKNCYIELDNTALGANSSSLSKAIGGGLARYGEIIIEDCVFKAINPSNPEPTQYDVSYHSANSSDVTDVHLIIRGCSFNGTFGAKDLIANPTKSPRLIFTNNSVASAPVVASSWDYLEWNNVVRS